MPIVGQQIIEDSPQADGRRYVRYRFTDQLGGTHTRGPILVPSGFDADADLLARIPQIDVELIDNETNSFEGNPLTATFKHTTKRKVLRRLLIRAMREDNPKALLKLKAVVVWIRANYTGAQVANYLNITIPQLTKLADRFDALVAVEATINADASEDIE